MTPDQPATSGEAKAVRQKALCIELRYGHHEDVAPRKEAALLIEELSADLAACIEERRKLSMFATASELKAHDLGKDLAACRAELKQCKDQCMYWSDDHAMRVMKIEEIKAELAQCRAELAALKQKRSEDWAVHDKIVANQAEEIHRLLLQPSQNQIDQARIALIERDALKAELAQCRAELAAVRESKQRAIESAGYWQNRYQQNESTKLSTELGQCKAELERCKELREGDNHLIRALASGVGIKITASDRMLGLQWEQFHDGVIAMHTELTATRAALAELRSDHQCTIDQYNKNGPTWTDKGQELYPASYVLQTAYDAIEKIDAALTHAVPSLPGAKEATP